jgi:hypothetical protein
MKPQNFVLLLGLIGLVVVIGAVTSSALLGQLSSSPPASFPWWAALIVPGGVAALFGGMFVFVYILDLTDKVKCRRHGHVPVHPKRMVWVKCDTCGESRFDHYEPITEEWVCDRCGKKLTPLDKGMERFQIPVTTR